MSRKIGIWVQSNQLHPELALFHQTDPENTPVCLIESQPILELRRFHKKRLVLTLSLQRHFADELIKIGYPVSLYALGDERYQGLCEQGEEACLRDFVEHNRISQLRVMECTEYDSNAFLLTLESVLGIPVEIIPNNQFLVDRQSFAKWYGNAESPTMETFYHKRRLETGLLIHEDLPVGGKWNFDMDNRVAPEGNLTIPPVPTFCPDAITRKVIQIVDKFFSNHPGDASTFSMPVTRRDVAVWMDDFIGNRLRLFGMYQDAMLEKSNRMYHSILSPYLNHGYILVADLLKKVSEAYQAGGIPINSAEGYIRQILGWREYIHGVYWRKMPHYRDENFLGFQRVIPEMMCTGDTNLKCVKCVLEQSYRDAYAHHIQRLMVIGNLALLVGIHPRQFLHYVQGIFIDAAEWAALPNVMGLILYADGGELGSKPYAASAHYINKMSDYCKGCHYKGKKRVGEKACPLNFLYWNFVGEHQGTLRNNPRMVTAICMYRTKAEAERKLIASSSKEFLAHLDEFGTDRKLKKISA